jgi:hypothetical protein
MAAALGASAVAEGPEGRPGTQVALRPAGRGTENPGPGLARGTGQHGTGAVRRQLAEIAKSGPTELCHDPR